MLTPEPARRAIEVSDAAQRTHGRQEAVELTGAVHAREPLRVGLQN